MTSGSTTSITESTTNMSKNMSKKKLMRFNSGAATADSHETMMPGQRLWNNIPALNPLAPFESNKELKATGGMSEVESGVSVASLLGVTCLAAVVMFAMFRALKWARAFLRKRNGGGNAGNTGNTGNNVNTEIAAGGEIREE